jgi:hypothetical protein
MEISFRLTTQMGGLVLTDKLALSIQSKPYCGYNNPSKQTYRMAMGRSGMDEIHLKVSIQVQILEKGAR